MLPLISHVTYMTSYADLWILLPIISYMFNYILAEYYANRLSCLLLLGIVMAVEEREVSETAHFSRSSPTYVSISTFWGKQLSWALGSRAYCVLYIACWTYRCKIVSKAAL